MVSFQMGRVARPCQEHDPLKFTNCTVENLGFRVPMRVSCVQDAYLPMRLMEKLLCMFPA